MWNGCTEKYIVKIYMTEGKEEMENREINETFYYNLRLELLDDNVWKMYNIESVERLYATHYINSNNFKNKWNWSA